MASITAETTTTPTTMTSTPPKPGVSLQTNSITDQQQQSSSTPPTITLPQRMLSYLDGLFGKSIDTMLDQASDVIEESTQKIIHPSPTLVERERKLRLDAEHALADQYEVLERERRLYESRLQDLDKRKAELNTPQRPPPELASRLQALELERSEFQSQLQRLEQQQLALSENASKMEQEKAMADKKIRALQQETVSMARAEGMEAYASQQEIARLQAELEWERGRRNEASQTEMTGLRGEFHDTMQKIEHDHQHEINALRNHIHDMEKTKNESLHRMAMEAQTEQERLVTLHQVELQTRVSEIARENENVIQRLMKENKTQLEQVMVQHQTELARLQSSSNIVNESTTTLVHDLAIMRSQHEIMRHERDAANVQVSGLAKDLALLRTECDGLRSVESTTVLALRHELESARLHVTEVEKERDTLQKSLNEAHVHLKTQTHNLAKLNEEFETTKQTLQTRDKEIAIHVAETNEVRRADAARDTQALNRVVQVTAQERDAAKIELDVVKGELTKARDMMSRLSQEVDTLQHVRKAVTRERDELIETLTKVQTEAVDLRLQNDQLREELGQYSEVLRLNEKTMSSFNASNSVMRDNIQSLVRSSRAQSVHGVIERLENAKKRRFFSVWKRMTEANESSLLDE